MTWEQKLINTVSSGHTERKEILLSKKISVDNVRKLSLYVSICMLLLDSGNAMQYQTI